MLHHYWTRILVLACTCVLIVGCSSLHTSGSAKARRETTGASSDVSEGDLEKRTAAHAHYGTAIIHEMNDEPDVALDEFYQAALDDPANEALTLDVSRRLLQAKQPQKALELTSRAAAQPNASGALFARLGMIQAHLGKRAEAIASDRTAIRKSPTALAGYQNLFSIYLLDRHTTNALAVLDEAALQSDVDAEFLLGVAGMYTALAPQMPSQRPQIKAKALALLARAEQAKPLTASLLLSLADQFEGAGDSAKAAQFYLRLLNEAAGMPVLREHLRAKLAEIYLRGSDHQRATEQLQAILRDDPANSIAYFYLGSIAIDEKKPAEAVEHFRKVILLNPDFEPAYYDLAGAQLSLDKGGDAIETLQAARKRFSQNFALEYWLGMAYSQQKAYAEAIGHYSTAEVIAAATDPKRLDQYFYFQLGAAHERNQDYEQAEKCFRKSLDLAPDFAESQNYLGYMWAERGVKLDQARELIEKALKAQPNNAAYLDSLGWVLFRLNQPAAALEHLLKSVELLTEPDPTVWDHLGDVYDALQQPDKAREAWQKSIRLESNDAIRKKLEHQGHK